MKPKIFFPFLLASIGLTALMLLFMSSAVSVAGLPAVVETPAETEPALPEAVTSVVPVTTTDAISLPWQAVTAGIDYVELRLQDPVNNVYVARMDRSALSITLETSIASGYLASGKESVSQMATRYDQAIGYWGQEPLTPTWGSRNDVIVAINGSYYEVPTGNPFSGMVHSGWYAKRFDDLGGSSGFAWKLDRSAFIGECVDHPGDSDDDPIWKQLITYTDGFSQTFQGINITRTNNSLMLFTPQYDVNTGTNDSGAEVLVELSRPLLIVPTPRAVTGTIQAIYTDTGSTPIPFDHVVLSAGKNVTNTMLAHVQVGQVISLSQEIKSYHFDCKTPFGLDWGKTYASLSGGFYFLKNRVVRYDLFNHDLGATTRAPRTAIVMDANYIYFVVVDGRDNWRSQGMTIDELAIFARDTLSATHGISQDGGGSSTMVVNGQVMNNTYCNNAYCYATFLPLVGQPEGAATLAEFDYEFDAPPIQTQPNLPEDVDAVTAERYVANGIMMVVVEPMQASTTFSPSQEVKTKVLIDLRLGPGTNYGSLYDIYVGTSGVIVNHELNGVLAKGSYWWKVNFDGVVGWVPESALR